MKSPMKQLLAVAMVMGAAGAASADTPRRLANNRPACGNTMGKGGPRTTCEWERSVESARASLANAEHELRFATPERRAEAAERVRAYRQELASSEKKWAAAKVYEAKARQEAMHEAKVHEARIREARAHEAEIREARAHEAEIREARAREAGARAAKTRSAKGTRVAARG